MKIPAAFDRTNRNVSLAASSYNAAIFNLCPLFLALVIAALLIAEWAATVIGLPSPSQSMTIGGLAPAFIVLGVPFVAASRPRTLRDWSNVGAAALILPLSNMIMPWVSGETIRTLANVYDASVADIDATLGAQPSYLIGELFTRHPLLALVCTNIYGAVMFPTAAVAALEALRGRRMGLGALPTFLVIAGAGFSMYHLLPVVGPAVHFGKAFPYATALPYLPAPRNAMPSLHTAWVLMALLATRGMSPLIRIALGVFVIGMMIATLGLGEHYLTDLVVAVPFVLLVRALCATELAVTSAIRIWSFVVALVFLAAWGLAVRGIVTPSMMHGLAPVAMLVTVLIPVWLEQRLARAAEMGAGLGNPDDRISGFSA